MRSITAQPPAYIRIQHNVKGTSLKTVQAVMGHQDIRTTEVYISFAFVVARQPTKTRRPAKKSLPTPSGGDARLNAACSFVGIPLT